MSQLRERFIRDLTIRNYSPSTIKSYVSALSCLGQRYKRCPSQITAEQIKQYLDELVKAKKSWSTINIVISSINRFYIETLGKDYSIERQKRPKKQSKLPCILSKEEVNRIISVHKNTKHRLILMTIYSAGLRIGELCRLKLTDIDSARMRIKIRNAKGHKDREVILSKILLEELREYYKKIHPKTYLFNGWKATRSIAVSTVRHIFNQAIKKCNIKKEVTPHSLRHSFATHLMDNGIDMRIIQSMMGHKSLKTTMIYCHLTEGKYGDIKSPLDDMSLN